MKIKYNQIVFDDNSTKDSGLVANKEMSIGDQQEGYAIVLTLLAHSKTQCPLYLNLIHTM